MPVDDTFPEVSTKLIVGFLITNEMQDRVVTIQEKKKEAVAPAEKKELVQEIKKTLRVFFFYR